MHPGRIIALSVWLWGALASLAAAEGAPQRVVSMNLCTDQLAMLLADPGQLISVSHIALDPLSSAMVTEAEAYAINYGRAEEIYLMRPDLVLTGTYTAPATVAMLRSLGIRVEQFAPSYSIADTRDQILAVGAALGQQEKARNMLDQFDAGLAALQDEVGARPRAVLYYANGYTSGDTTLAGQILSAAGFANAATEAGYGAGARLPLELLAMIDPDLVIASAPYAGGSRSEEILSHPVVSRFELSGQTERLMSADWVCGTPYVLRAIEKLRAARQSLQRGRP